MRSSSRTSQIAALGFALAALNGWIAEGYGPDAVMMCTPE